MHQSCRLESIARSFIGHFVRREPAEFLINEREQLIGSLGITMFDGVEDARDVAHAFQGSGPNGAYNAKEFTV